MFMGFYVATYCVGSASENSRRFSAVSITCVLCMCPQIIRDKKTTIMKRTKCRLSKPRHRSRCTGNKPSQSMCCIDFGLTSDMPARVVNMIPNEAQKIGYQVLSCYFILLRKQNFRRFSISVMHFGCTPKEPLRFVSGGSKL